MTPVEKVALYGGIVLACLFLGLIIAALSGYWYRESRLRLLASQQRAPPRPPRLPSPWGHPATSRVRSPRAPVRRLIPRARVTPIPSYPVDPPPRYEGPPDFETAVAREEEGREAKRTQDSSPSEREVLDETQSIDLPPMPSSPPQPEHWAEVYLRGGTMCPACRYLCRERDSSTHFLPGTMV